MNDNKINRFRIWDVCTKNMILPDHTHKKNSVFMSLEGFLFVHNQNLMLSLSNRLIMMRSIGLKDIGLEEIFEGDIFEIEAPYLINKARMVIEWCQDGLEWIALSKNVKFINGEIKEIRESLCCYVKHNKLNHKVIGNKYTNYDLLEYMQEKKNSQGDYR